MHNIEQAQIFVKHTYIPAEVAAGVWSVQPDFPHRRSANPHAEGPFIIDPGNGDFRELIRNVGLIYGGFDRTFFLLLTHVHIDHVNNAARLRKYIEDNGGTVFVVALKGNRDIVYQADSGQTAENLYPGERFVGTHIDYELHDGEVLETEGHWVKILETGGHSDIHASYIVDGRTLYPGDIGGIMSVDFHSDLTHALESIAKIRGEFYDIVIEPHGSGTTTLSRVVFEHTLTSHALTPGDYHPGFAGHDDPIFRAV